MKLFPHLTATLHCLPQIWGGEALCAYWDHMALDGQGDWATDGCYYNGTHEGRLLCVCNHLTNFAVLAVSMPLFVF
jgi:hypothetical protein